jgi:hypothetical protein
MSVNMAFINFSYVIHDILKEVTNILDEHAVSTFMLKEWEF